MTWPMHDAGSTTPEPDSGEPELSERGAGPGRHAAADPLPPLDGPMPGGGPSPAETTLPLALEWPAPPAGTLRTPRFTPSGPPGPGRIGGRAAGLAPGAPAGRLPATR